MPKFIVNQWDFTTEELERLEQEMKKYKPPFLYKYMMKFLYNYGAIVIPLTVLVVAILGFIYMNGNLYFDLWPIIKGIALTLIIGVGLLGSILHMWNRFKIRRYCKKLGITEVQWNQLVIAFQIKLF